MRPKWREWWWAHWRMWGPSTASGRGWRCSATSGCRCTKVMFKWHSQYTAKYFLLGFFSSTFHFLQFHMLTELVEGTKTQRQEVKRRTADLQSEIPSFLVLLPCFFPCLNSLVEGLLNYTLYVECLICFSISVHFKKLSFTISKFNG